MIPKFWHTTWYSCLAVYSRTHSRTRRHTTRAAAIRRNCPWFQSCCSSAASSSSLLRSRRAPRCSVFLKAATKRKKERKKMRKEVRRLAASADEATETSPRIRVPRTTHRTLKRGYFARMTSGVSMALSVVNPFSIVNSGSGHDAFTRMDGYCVPHDPTVVDSSGCCLAGRIISSIAT
jgi:hypothetical protein